MMYVRWDEKIFISCMCIPYLFMGEKEMDHRTLFKLKTLLLVSFYSFDCGQGSYAEKNRR